MRSYSFVTVDVFTDRRFGGNPLAGFPDASGLSDAEMQSLAAEFNLSETTLVVPPENPSNTPRVPIFNRTSQMPFAGHPPVSPRTVVGSRVLGPRGLPLYLYAQDGQNADALHLRARMFSPLSGTVEDAATGSAAAPLAALLLSLTKVSERRCDITQGVEMGRPSLLACSARPAAAGVRASVGGGCVAVLKGEVSL